MRLFILLVLYLVAADIAPRHETAATSASALRLRTAVQGLEYAPGIAVDASGTVYATSETGGTVNGRLTIGPTSTANSGSFVPFLPGGGH